MSNARKFWSFRPLNAAETELLLYGEISDVTWWGDEVTPQMFIDELKAVGDVGSITVRINSYGGDVFAAHAIHNVLRQHKAEVIVRIDGIAASAATIVAMAGDRIIMPANAMMMIHNPWTLVMGEADDMRKAAEALDKIKDSIVAAYAARTGQSVDKLIELMDAETWMTAAEAVEMGFADEAEEEQRVAASIGGGALVINGTRFDLGRMKSIPAALFAGEEVSNLGKTVNTPVEPTPAPEVTPVEGADPVTDPEPGADPAPVVEPVTDPAPAPAGDPTPAPVTDPEPADPVQNAIRAERDRINAINALTRPGAEEIIAAAIEGGLSAEATALQILNSAQVRNIDTLHNRRQDAAVLNGIKPTLVADAADSSKAKGFVAAVGHYAKVLVKGRTSANAKTE